MDTEDYLAALTPGDIRETLRPCADVIGAENLYKLCEAVGGTRVCFPKPGTLFDGVKRRLIAGEYATGGYTIAELAEKHQVCEKTVHNYIHDK